MKDFLSARAVLGKLRKSFDLAADCYHAGLHQDSGGIRHGKPIDTAYHRPYHEHMMTTKTMPNTETLDGYYESEDVSFP